MENKSLLIKAEEAATQILKSEISSKLAYHSYTHTKMVVNAATLIAEEENLNSQEKEIVIVAAWFHDTGFKEAYDGHEAVSRQIAIDFLKENNADEATIERVSGCILSTMLTNTPTNKLEEVICDADISHIARENYEECSELLRQEWANVHDKHYTDLEWCQMSLEFITTTEFYTEYGKTELNNKREEVKKKLKKKLKKIKKNLDVALTDQLGISEEELKSMKKKLLKAEGKPERGIETMFRLTSKNHITLSTMADSKANILISVNSIIISILIGALMQKLDSNPHLIIPTIILLAVNLGAIVFAILSIRPNVTKGLFTRADIEDHRTNLLFFGNFHKMKRDDYHWGMNRLMENKSFLYSSLIDDVYFLGVVLARKYRLLRTAYNIFMFGIVIAVVAFAISNFYAEPKI